MSYTGKSEFGLKWKPYLDRLRASIQNDPLILLSNFDDGWRMTRIAMRLVPVETLKGTVTGCQSDVPRNDSVDTLKREGESGSATWIRGPSLVVIPVVRIQARSA